jgi:hypothetical protein
MTERIVAPRLADIIEAIPIVVGDPYGNLGPRIIEVEEQCLVQELVTHAAVEALHERILDRFAWRNEAPVDTGLLAPSLASRVAMPSDNTPTVIPTFAGRTTDLNSPTSLIRLNCLLCTSLLIAGWSRRSNLIAAAIPL